MHNLTKLYENPEKIVVTAHRGLSGRYPENTLPAFQAAVELGVDIIEFDVRGARDRTPVVLHDATLDRTTDGTGSPGDYSVAELQQHNASYWEGDHVTGRRLSRAARPDVSIPTFEEVLRQMKGKVGFNIQVYETDPPLLSAVCRLYDAYDLYQDGYLTVSTHADAEKVRRLNPRIELCVLETQGHMGPQELRRYKHFGCRFVQPRRDDVTPSFCRHVKDLGLFANMFYSNTDEDNRRFIGYGIQGILTDYPDVLLDTLRHIKLHAETRRDDTRQEETDGR